MKKGYLILSVGAFLVGSGIGYTAAKVSGMEPSLEFAGRTGMQLTGQILGTLGLIHLAARAERPKGGKRIRAAQPSPSFGRDPLVPNCSLLASL